MLNALMYIRQSLLSWGSTIPTQLHSRMQPNPAGADKSPRLLLTLKPDDTFVVQNFNDYSEKHHVTWSSPKLLTALSYKFHNGEPNGGLTRLSDKFTTMIERHRELWLVLTEQDQSVNELSILCDRLAKVNFSDLCEAIVKLLKLNGLNDLVATTIYMSFDLSDKPIQNMEFFQRVSQAMTAVETKQVGSQQDVFGNAATNIDSKNGLKIQIRGVGPVFLFSRNNDNECYAKYDLNSVLSCPLGPISRQLAAETLNHLLDSDRQIDPLRGENTTGRWFIARRNQRSNTTDVVLTSLYPNDSIIESGAGSIPNDEWERRAAEVLQGLVKQREINQGTFGNVIVLRQHKGPTQLRYASSKPIETLITQVQRWIEGRKNGPFILQRNVSIGNPSVFGAYFDINKAWKFSTDRVSPLNNEIVTIETAYDFFFDQPEAIEKMTMAYVHNTVPMLVKMDRLQYYPQDALRLLALGNLILHKRGHIMSSQTAKIPLHQWPFILGQLFSAGNRLHYEYFNTRGYKAPDLLHGQRSIQAAYFGARQAYAMFVQNMQPALNWLETNRSPALVETWKILQSELADLINETPIPHVMMPEQKILMSQGYYYVPVRNIENNQNGTEALPNNEVPAITDQPVEQKDPVNSGE